MFYFLEIIQTQAFDVLFHCGVDIVLFYFLVKRIKEIDRKVS